MQYELDRRIESILEPDYIRDYLFDQAYDFIKYDATNVNWDIVEDGNPITNVYLYFCKELKDYIENVRPEHIDNLRVTELNYYGESNSSVQPLLDLIVEIENEDEYHLHQIVSLRKYMNYAS